MMTMGAGPSAPPVQQAEGTANLWIDSDGGTCTRQSSPAAYSNAAACGSFNAAYVAATSGDTVGVTGTISSEQRFAGAGSSGTSAGTKTLTFQGAAGNKVFAIHIGSPNLTFDGVNLDADAGEVSGGRALFENGGEGFVFKNATVGDTTDSKGALLDGEFVTGAETMTFDNVDFHDVRIVGEGVHTECIQALYMPNFVLTNSTFTNCAIMDLSLGYPDFWNPLPPAYGDVTIEGNTFGTSRTEGEACCAAISLAFWQTDEAVDVGDPGFDDDIDDFGEMNNWIVRNNYLEPGSSFVERLDNVTSGTGNTICGNTGDFPTAYKVSC